MTFKFCKNSALVVVDMQHCFASKGGMIYVPQAESQIPTIIAYVNQALEERIPVIHTAVVWDTVEDIPRGLASRMPRILEGWDKDNGLKRGTYGSRLHHPYYNPPHIVVEKKSFDAFYNTDLEQKLKNLGVDTIYLIGTTASNCVHATARGAFYRNIGVVALADGISDFSEEQRMPALNNIEKFIGEVIW
jgi:nicotinamidase-related amidase